MEVDRVDGRTPYQLRPLACSRNLLNRAHGSARWSQGDTIVLAAVYGPKSGNKKNENPEKASIEVVWKPKTGQIGKAEREYEMILRRKLQAFSYLVFPNSAQSVLSEESKQAEGEPMEHGIITSVTRRAMSGIMMLLSWLLTFLFSQTPNFAHTSELMHPSCGAFGGNRGMRPVPPEKGVFPLDHMHECGITYSNYSPAYQLEKKEYISCLKTLGFQSEICRRFSKKYLECRMENSHYPHHVRKSKRKKEIKVKDLQSLAKIHNPNINKLKPQISKFHHY
ncbi:hypothetical protein MKW92_013090 [Papaver armeniacum]|nr:hypothetical protein MKW92_013090 [Papaver armeniacum]